MKNFNKTIKSNNSINSFNPSSYISKIINCRQNKNLTKIKINTPLLFYRNKYSNSLKAQNLHYNFKNNNMQKILENTDLTNDIKIHNNNSAYKASLSTNNTNTNYYTKRRRQLYKNIKTVESETTQSRNINKYNGKSLSRTTWSSFSFTEGTNNVNQLINEYDYDHNRKYQKLKNDNNNNNNNNNNEIKFNEYNINKLKENGIKYCIDENGNPMNLIDIILKDKKPIAFIIQKQNKNILIDLDNKIVIPNINGDYILNQKPYFVIKKYNVQYPELRVNNLDNYNNNKDNNYISINVNESNENIKYNNNNFVLNREKNFRRKNNKSCNLYNYANLGEGLDKLNAKLENNNKLKENRINVMSPNNQIKKNTYKLFKNSLREKKRKYIFVNKLPDTNKSIQLKIKNNQNNNNNDNDNENFNNSIKKLIQSSNTCKNKDIDKIYFFNDNKKESISLIEKKNKNNNNTKLFLKNLNKLKKGINKLKDIKCFTHNEIKNLEFKFERKYKDNINSANSTQPCFLTEYKFRKIEETPKDNKEKCKIKKQDKTITIKTDNINTTNNIESEYRANTTKKYLIDNLDNLDLKNYKKKRCSYSLNQFMFNSLENNNNVATTPQNMINTLSAFNHSFISPTTETTSYNTIQNLHMDLEKDKKRIINNNSINIKKFHSFKYYLKPKINSQKVFHKRIKTEDMNRCEKRFRFFKSLCGNNIINKNNVNNNSLRSFYNTESDFSINNCKHILSNSVEKKINIFNNTNNSVCKCPYCHHLFYSLNN